MLSNFPRTNPTTVVLPGKGAAAEKLLTQPTKSAKKREKQQERAFRMALETKAIAVAGEKKHSAQKAAQKAKSKKSKNRFGALGNLWGPASEKTLADRYAVSLVAPELGAIADYPDDAPYRASKIPTGFTQNIAPITDSAAGSNVRCCGVIVSPQLLNHYFLLTGYNSTTGAISWDGGHNHPQYSTFLADFPLFQPLSLAATLFQQADTQDLSGIFYANQMISGDVSGASGSLPTNVTDLTTSPYTAVIGGSQDDNVRLNWLPPNTVSAQFFDITNQATNAGYLCLIWIGNPVTLVESTGSMAFNVHFNIAVEPDEAIASLFNPVPSVGGDDTYVARALRLASEVSSTIGNTVGALDQWLESSSIGQLGSLALAGMAARGGMRGQRGMIRLNSDSKRNRARRKLCALFGDLSLRNEIAQELKLSVEYCESIAANCLDALKRSSRLKKLRIDVANDDGIFVDSVPTPCSSVIPGSATHPGYFPTPTGGRKVTVG